MLFISTVNAEEINNETIISNNPIEYIDEIENSNTEMMDKNSNNQNLIENDSDVEINQGTRLSFSLQTSDLTKYYMGSEKFTAQLISPDGSLIVSGQSINFIINGITYTRITNSNGIADLTINLNSGSYTIYTQYSYGNGAIFIQKINTIIIKPTITGNDLTKYYKNNTQYHATFRNSAGSLLTNTAVTFNINGVIYSRTTNSNGQATLNINLQPGTYILTAINPSNSEMLSNTVTVLPVLIANDTTLKQGTQFKVLVLNGQGQPYSGQTVSFNINGMIYSRISDVTGYAKLTINLNPSTYIITSSYNGMSISNTIIVTS